MTDIAAEVFDQNGAYNAGLTAHQPDLASKFKRSFAELTRIDAALRDAEARLQVAHVIRDCRERALPEAAYLDVLELRRKTKQVLNELAEFWVNEG